ncbi:MAG: DUF6443 domain-containing protein, partial [Chloroflexota bacterium]
MYRLRCNCGDTDQRLNQEFESEWHVDTATDAYGNQIVYIRDNSIATNVTGAGTVVTIRTYGSRTTDILYNFNETVGQYPVAGPFDGMDQLTVEKAGSQVHFVYDEAQLVRIEILHDRINQPHIMDRYSINTASKMMFDECTDDYKSNDLDLYGRVSTTRVVTSIQRSSRLPSQNSSFEALPAVKFHYQALSNFDEPFRNESNNGYNINGTCFQYFRLYEVENGYGGSVQFEYASDGRDQRTDVGRYVDQINNGPKEYPKVANSWYITQTRVADGIGNILTTKYIRHNKCYIQTENTGTKCDFDDQPYLPAHGTLAGFGTVTTEVYTADGDDILQRTVTVYNRGNLGFGQPNEVTTFSRGENGALQKTGTVVTNFHDELIHGAAFRPIKDQTTYSFEIGTEIAMSSRITYTYGSEHGRLMETKTFINGALDKKVVRDFEDEPSNEPSNERLWWVGRLEKVSQYQGESTLLLETHYEYDDGGKNRVTPTEVRVGHPNEPLNGGTNGFISTSTSYDDRGNAKTTTDANGNQTTIVYDPEFELYPVRVIGPGTNNCVAFAIYGFEGVDCQGNQMSISGSGIPGLLGTVIDPNRLATSYRYDVHGRLVATYLPNDSVDSGNPTSSITYMDTERPFRVENRTKSDLAPKVVQYYDGLGRPIMTEQQGVKIDTGAAESTENVLALTGYDEMGQAVRQTVPFVTDINLNNSYYGYDITRRQFKEVGYEETFDTGFNVSQWEWLDSDVTVTTLDGYAIINKSGDVGVLKRNPVTQGQGGSEDIITFDFAVRNPGEGRLTAAIIRSEWGQADFGAVYIEAKEETLEAVFHEGTQEVSRVTLMPLTINAVDKKGSRDEANHNSYSMWYRAEIYRAGNNFQISVVQKSDPTVRGTASASLSGASMNDDWYTQFSSESDRVSFILDNYREYPTLSSARMSGTVYGYSLPSDDLHHPADTLSYATNGEATKVINTISTNVTVNGDSKLSKQVITAPNSISTEYYTNTEGELVLVRENGSTDTRYTYDDYGNLIRVRRQIAPETGFGTPLAPDTVMTYDVLGRKQTMNDPDMGNWAYTYDANSNLKTQLDANGSCLLFEYDSQNRMTHKYFVNYVFCALNAPNQVLLAEYTYGTDPNANNVGQLTQVEWARDAAFDSETFAYDAYGRLDVHTRVIDGETFTMETTEFDDLSRPKEMIYPDGELVVIGYDTSGANTLTAGGRSLVADIQYNINGQMTLLDRAGSGGYDTTYSYYGAIGGVFGNQANANFRLETIQHGDAGVGAGNPADYSYEYEAGGNISTISESGVADVTFTYDNLNRLKTASGLYSDTYEYDQLGNLREKGGVRLNYPGANPQPHAVQSTTDGWSFSYDNNGN